jgi:hypothetical protein
MRDTPAFAEQVRLAAIRRMPPDARLRQALELSEWVRNIALEAQRRRHPDRTDLELVELMVERPLNLSRARSGTPAGDP